MRAPTRRELEILRYLAVGMVIVPPARNRRYPVECKGVEVIAIQEATLAALIDEGWVERDTLAITARGRAVAEVKAFVRAFAERA